MLWSIDITEDGLLAIVSKTNWVKLYSFDSTNFTLFEITLGLQPSGKFGRSVSLSIFIFDENQGKVDLYKNGHT